MKKKLWKWVAGRVSVRGLMCLLLLSGVSLAGCGGDENQDPVAKAGDDQEAERGSIVQLDCTASSDPDGDDLTHSWTQLFGPSVALVGALTATPSFEAPDEDAELVFEVTVDDGRGGSDSDRMSVRVTAREDLNEEPIADAGDDQSAEGGSIVSLDSTASSDPDGDDLRHSWTQLAGPPVALAGALTARPTFEAPDEDAELLFEVTVDDGMGGSDSDRMSVRVRARGDLNNEPVADAGDDQDVEGRSIIALDSTASSDPDGDDLTHSWTQLSGPPVALAGALTATPTFEAPNEDVELEFEVIVDDGRGGLDSDRVIVLITAKRARLYIANYTGHSVTSYEDPALVIGDIPPDTNLQGASTLLDGPSDIIVTAEGMLIASNYAGDALTSYWDAPTTNGNFAPDGNVSGAATALDGPTSLAVNKGEDLVFVANISSDEITVYAGVSAPSFSGGLAPVRTIRTTTSGDLAGPVGINFGADDDLYVANSGPNNVLVFEGASRLTGDVLPDRTITCTEFDLIYDVFIDSEDKMYVVDAADGEVYIFDDASSLHGPQIPDFTLTIPGASFLTAIAVDSQGIGYVVDLFAEAIYSYDDIGRINGAFLPDRTIEGPRTLMDGPIRVFLEE